MSHDLFCGLELLKLMRCVCAYVYVCVPACKHTTLCPDVGFNLIRPAATITVLHNPQEYSLTRFESMNEIYTHSQQMSQGHKDIRPTVIIFMCAPHFYCQAD